MPTVKNPSDILKPKVQPTPAAVAASAPPPTGGETAEPAPGAPPQAPESGSAVAGTTPTVTDDAPIPLADAPPKPPRFRVGHPNCKSHEFDAPDAHAAILLYREWAGINATIHPFSVEQC